MFSLNVRFDRSTSPWVVAVLAAPWRSWIWLVLQNAFIFLFSIHLHYLLKFFEVAISYTILLNFIQYFISKFVIDGMNINKLCVVINNIYSPLVLWLTFTWAISEIHNRQSFNQGKEWFSLKRTYHRFHSGGYGFLLCVKTAKKNKSIHNFLCYFGRIISNLFLSFLLPSVSNSIMAFRKYIKEHSLICNFFPFCG